MKLGLNSSCILTCFPRYCTFVFLYYSLATECDMITTLLSKFSRELLQCSPVIFPVCRAINNETQICQLCIRIICVIFRICPPPPIDPAALTPPPSPQSPQPPIVSNPLPPSFYSPTSPTTYPSLTRPYPLAFLSSSLSLATPLPPPPPPSLSAVSSSLAVSITAPRNTVLAFSVAGPAGTLGKPELRIRT